MEGTCICGEEEAYSREPEDAYACNEGAGTCKQEVYNETAGIYVRNEEDCTRKQEAYKEVEICACGQDVYEEEGIYACNGEVLVVCIHVQEVVTCKHEAATYGANVVAVTVAVTCILVWYVVACSSELVVGERSR